MNAGFPDIPGYEIEEVLGKGGFATVYLARQVLLQRLVALKVMDPSLAADREFCDRFVREARDTAGLGNHTNIVTVHDIGRIEDYYYIALQYLPGPNLKELLEADEPYQHPLHIMERLADALAYAHARGFVHRDIKPANILFNEAGEAVLSDFGIAKSLGRETQLTLAGSIIGTARYMSPEQAMGRDSIDGRSDLYSLGVMFFELLTRSPPFSSPDGMQLMLKHVHEPIPRLPESEAIYQPLIDKLMAKRPEERFPSGEALLEELARYMERETATVARKPALGSNHGSSWRMAGWAGGVVAATALAAGLVFVGLESRLPGSSPEEDDPQTAGVSERPVSAVAGEEPFSPDTPLLDETVRDASLSGTASVGGRAEERVPLDQASIDAATLAEPAQRPAAIVQGATDVSVGTSAVRPSDVPVDRIAVSADTVGSESVSGDGSSAASQLAAQGGGFDADPSVDPGTGVPASGDAPAILRDQRTLSASDQQRIVRLLDVAELHELVGRISEPPGSNAIEAYELVLEIDGSNTFARAALSRLKGAL